MEHRVLMEYTKATIAGTFIGWANAIPGVSGGTLAVITGVFERLIEILNDFINLKIGKRDLAFLLFILIGLLIGLVTGSKILTWGFENYPFYTYSFFYGLVLFSLVNIKDNVKFFKPLEFIVGVLIVVLPYFVKVTMEKNHVLNNELALQSTDYIFLFIAGIIAGSSMVLPGLSGSLILMILGFYEKAISIVSKATNIKSLTNSDLFFLTILGIGVLFGIVIIAKILKIWFERAKVSIMNFILGLVSGSLYPITPAFHGRGSMLGMLLWIAIGSTIVYFLGKVKDG